MTTELQWDAVYWELSGSELSPRNPPLPVAPRADVRYGAPHLDGLGRLVLPAVGNVAFPVGYGTDGTELVGTLIAGFPPTPPLLTVSDLGSLLAQFSVAGSTPGSSNQVFIRKATELAWPTVPVATIAGDGTATYTVDAAGPYLAKVQSHLAGAVSPASNEPVLFYMVDVDAGYTRSDFGDEFDATVNGELLEAFGEPLTYRRGIETVTLVGIEGEGIQVRDPATGADFVVGDGSWEIDADDLDFGAGPIVPRTQDQIITAKGEIWIVLGTGTLDAEQLFWTIPVKRGEYKELP